MFKWFADNLNPLGQFKPAFGYAFSFGDEGGGGTPPATPPAGDPPATPPTTPPAADWREPFGAEAKTDPEMANYKTPQDFYKSHKNAVALVGKKGVIVPGEKDAPEVWDKFYSDLGRPKEAKEYKFAEIKNAHPKIAEAKIPEALRGIVHKAGLTGRQADIVNAEVVALLSNTATAQDKMTLDQRNAAETELRGKLGANYEAKIALAKRSLLKFGGQEGLDAFGDLGSNPKVLSTLISIADRISEDSRGALGFSTLETSHEGAERRIAEINAMNNDPKSPLRDASHPDHQKIVDERESLYKFVCSPANQQ